MIKIKDFNKFIYVKDKHDNVWKYIPSKDHFLKISPWKNGEDRRINRYLIEKLITNGKLVQYTKRSGIREIINKRWDNVDFEWDYNGDHFIVDALRSNDDIFFKAKIHKFPQTYKDRNGKETTYYNEYRLVFYNGHLVWATPLHYWPQVILWTFESEDKEPSIKSDMRWVNGKHLRPIYSVKNGDYI